MNRMARVVRMQLVNRQTFIWVPLIVLGGAFVVSIAIYLIIRQAGGEGPFYGGGAQAPLWYFAVVGAQAMTLSFPFSQAMSVTRREFYLGTLLTAAGTAAGLAVIFLVGGLVEQATGGWGIDGYFFALDWLWAAGPLVAFLFYFGIAMLFFVVGFAGATVYKRFGNMALTIVWIALALIALLAIWLITINGWWGPLFTGIAEAGPTGLTFALLGVAAVLAVVSFPVLRRAVP